MEASMEHLHVSGWIMGAVAGSRGAMAGVIEGHSGPEQWLFTNQFRKLNITDNWCVPTSVWQWLSLIEYLLLAWLGLNP